LEKVALWVPVEDRSERSRADRVEKGHRGVRIGPLVVSVERRVRTEKRSHLGGFLRIGSRTDHLKDLPAAVVVTVDTIKEDISNMVVINNKHILVTLSSRPQSMRPGRLNSSSMPLLMAVKLPPVLRILMLHTTLN